MAWVIKRQSEDDSTIFEVFVSKSDLRENFGDRYIPASAVADTLDREDKSFHCSGYELAKHFHTSNSYNMDVYIFTCTCDEPCTLYTMATYANYWIDWLKERYYAD